LRRKVEELEKKVRRMEEEDREGKGGGERGRRRDRTKGEEIRKDH